MTNAENIERIVKFTQRLETLSHDHGEGWNKILNSESFLTSPQIACGYAISVMDKISKDVFELLTRPFAEILVELGIVWASPTLSEVKE
jgi:hypothetical protein